MFCPNCGKYSEDGASYCDNCGNALQPAGIRPGTQVQLQPQVQYAAGNGSGRPEGRRGLIIWLAAGGVVLAAAIIAAVLLLAGGQPIAGVWYSEDRGEVIEFKSDNSFYLHSVSDNFKGEYTFDKSKSEGIVTLEGQKYEFTVNKEEVDVDGIGKFDKAKENFKTDEFLAKLPTPASPTETPTPEPSPTPEPTATAQIAAAQPMTLPLVFGESTGTYTGEISNGLPEGYGTFVCPYPEDTSWIYEGYWAGGHMSGQGRTTWNYGFSEEGEYVGDLLNGQGNEYWYNRIYYSGEYLNSASHGQGTLYNYYEEPIFTGAFSYGFIKEAPEDRAARLEAFKTLCLKSECKDMYEACSNDQKVYAYVEGTVFDVYKYAAGNEYYCDFLMYESGVEDTGRIVQVFYRMSEGEPYITEGQPVKVWGTTAYLYSYTSEGNEYLTVPTIEAWSVE